MLQSFCFNCAKLVAILNFLSTFKQALNTDQITKVAALEIMGSFMDHDARTLFFLMMNDNAEELGGFCTRTHSVKLVYRAYANDRELESAVDAIKNMPMVSNKKVNDFYGRLAATGRDLAGAYMQ